MSFSQNPVNAAFPVEFFSGDALAGLVSQYGALARDGALDVLTLYCRQDTSNPDSRRAAGTANESPVILANGKMLVVSVYPSTAILEAIANGTVQGVDLIPDEELEGYIQQHQPT